MQKNKLINSLIKKRHSRYTIKPSNINLKQTDSDLIQIPVEAISIANKNDATLINVEPIKYITNRHRRKYRRSSIIVKGRCLFNPFNSKNQIPIKVSNKNTK